MNFPFVRRKLYTSALATIDHQTELVKSLEALLFKCDPNWQARHNGNEFILINDVGYVDVRDLVGKNLLLRQASEIPAVDCAEDIVEVTVLAVAGQNFHFSYKKGILRFPSIAARTRVSAWSRFDNFEILAVLPVKELEEQNV